MPSGAGQVVDEVLDSGFIACGPKTKLFEEKFGEFKKWSKHGGS